MTSVYSNRTMAVDFSVSPEALDTSGDQSGAIVEDE